MQNTKWETVTKEECTTVSITCDVCKTTYDCDEVFETQEFISISHDCGFGSVFGDNHHMNIDICQHCFKSIFSEHVRLIDWSIGQQKVKEMLARMKKIDK
jgi:hypothetical protein